MGYGDGVTMDTRISLKKLEILCLVVELGGIGRAADHMHVSQPVVTAHMRMLQERVGAPLLYRDGARMQLTEAGEAVYAWATEVLSRSRELSREIEGLAGGEAGTVVVASSMSVGSYLLPWVLSEFCLRRPLASVKLQVSDAEDAQRAAESGECDFAVITSGSRVDGAVRAEHIGDHDLVLVAAPDAAVGDCVTAEELALLPFVCSPAGRPRRRLVEGALRRLGIVERSVAIELGHPEALKTATRRGLGVAMLLRASVQSELDSGALREVKIAEGSLTVPILLVNRAGKRFTPLQLELVDVVRDAFGDAAVDSDSATAIPA